MKRDDLKNLGITDPEVLDKIMDMNGADRNAERQKGETSRADIQSKLDKATADLAEMTKKMDGFKDFDTIKGERDTLLAEKNKRAITDRFNSALGQNKPLNDFTRDGLLAKFEEEIGKAENKDKKDADILSGLVNGKEKELFAGKFTLDMTPSGNPAGKHSDNDVFPTRIIRV